MKHAVLGAGGIGGLVAGALARSGEQVTLILRQASLAAYPKAIHIESQVLGTFSTPVGTATGVPPGTEVLWVTVKANQLEEALRAAPADALGAALVIPFLNGIHHVRRLREAYGDDRVAAAVIRVEAEKAAPGRFRQLGPFLTAQIAGPPFLLPRLSRVVAALSAAGIACSLEPNEEQALWGKLFMLGPLALATAASGHDLGGLRADPSWWIRATACSEELRAVAAAEGVAIAGAWSERVAAAPDGMRTSMQKDVDGGREPELDGIAGPILRGPELGVPVPVTEQLVATIRSRLPRP